MYCRPGETPQVGEGSLLPTAATTGQGTEKYRELRVHAGLSCCLCSPGGRPGGGRGEGPPAALKGARRESEAAPGLCVCSIGGTYLLGEVILQLREEKQHHDEPTNCRHCRGDENHCQRRRNPEPLSSTGLLKSHGHPQPPRSPSAPPHVLTRKSSRVLGKASNRFSRHNDSMTPRSPEANPSSGVGHGPAPGPAPGGEQLSVPG